LVKKSKANNEEKQRYKSYAFDEGARPPSSAQVENITMSETGNETVNALAV
jgi:hypothetical protein